MSTAPEPANTPPEPPQRFPFITVLATLGVLFAFVFLIWLAAREDNPLAEPKPETTDSKEEEPKLDAAAKLDEVNNRNKAALDGIGAKMSRDAAHAKLMATLKGPNDKLPFPTPEPPVVTTQKKGEKDKKGDAGKNP
jgi:hypothetical protein